MFPDGICRVTENYYTKTIQFQDINYQLSQNEDKSAIFDGWCDFLNYFDASIHFQLSFLNMAATRTPTARRSPFRCVATPTMPSAPNTRRCFVTSWQRATTA